jgi:hypothetical protein
LSLIAVKARLSFVETPTMCPICWATLLATFALAMGTSAVVIAGRDRITLLLAVPLYPVLPAAVLPMSILSAVIYGWSQEQTVLWLTAGMYGLGLSYYFCRGRIVAAAPEESGTPFSQ